MVESQLEIVKQNYGSAALLAGLTAIFYAFQPERHPFHRLDRSLADAAVVLLAVALAIGPLARLWKGAAPALRWRREIAVWGFIGATLHVLAYAWMRWGGDVTRLYTEPEDSFQAGVWVGTVALVYGLLLTITSNNRSEKLLKRGWKFIQQRATTFWTLVIVHAVLFLYLHGTANPLNQAIVFGAAASVLVLQSAAFVDTLDGPEYKVGIPVAMLKGFRTGDPDEAALVANDSEE